jgi:enoyl-CoA hydratase/carnithine racemase
MSVGSVEAKVLYETRGAVARLTIDRAESRNALDPATVLALTRGLESALADPAVRAIVLTGAGEKAFCAGADLKPASGSFAPDYSQPTSDYANLLRAARACTLPIVGRINGACLAGGMGLLGVCDMAVAADDAIFGLPEVKVGIFPMQVLSVLRDLVPPRVLAELCLTGEPVSAIEAQRVGLINYAVPRADLDAKVDWLVERLVGKSPTAQRRGKFALRAIDGMDFAAALAYLETQIATLTLTEDAREGRAAFAERRAPQWTGR